MRLFLVPVLALTLLAPGLYAASTPPPRAAVAVPPLPAPPRVQACEPGIGCPVFGGNPLWYVYKYGDQYWGQLQFESGAGILFLPGSYSYSQSETFFDVANGAYIDSNGPIVVKENGSRVLTIQPTSISANVLIGTAQNVVADGVEGATVGGGGNSTTGGPNEVLGNFSTVAGGAANVAGAAGQAFATVAGGNFNNATGAYDTIAGGVRNTAKAAWTSVVGGYANTANGNFAFIGGGDANVAPGLWAAVPGGYANHANNNFAAIGGGGNNVANGLWSTVAGGYNGIAGANFDTIGGGDSNAATGSYSVVSGGVGNSATASVSTVAGGDANTASGGASFVAGGENNVASGAASFAAGDGAHAVHNGAFVWSDTQCCAPFYSTGENQFSVRATGGVRFVTAVDSNGNPTAGVSLAQGSGSWSSLSDRNAKTDFQAVDPLVALSLVSALPISEWSYKSQPGVTHLGPMAQDFRAAFGLGEDDTHIDTVDEEGVALAAIQGLQHELQQKDAQLARQQAQLDAQTDQLGQQQGHIDDLEQRLAHLEEVLGQSS